MPESKPTRNVPLAEVSIFDLINAFNDVLKKASARDDFHEIVEEKFTVSDKIEEILYTLRDRSEMLFSELFARGDVARGNRRHVSGVAGVDPVEAAEGPAGRIVRGNSRDQGG